MFPDIPGAITAADSLEQAYAQAVEVAHIQLAERAFLPLPAPVYVPGGKHAMGVWGDFRGTGPVRG